MKTFKALTAGLIAGAVAVSSFTYGGEARADYPEKTIHIVVPWKAGGGTDSIARALATAMEEVSDQSVVIENISGGARVPGTMSVANADPDGYRMLLNGSSDISSTIVFRDVPFKLDDFVCVGGVYQTPVWIVANKAQGFESFDDFIAAAKKKPGELAIGVTTLNSPDETLVKMLAQKQGIDIRIIPFNGGAALRKALLGNQVPAGMLYVPVGLTEIKSGDLKAQVAGGSLKGVNFPPVRDTKIPSDYGADITIGSFRGVLMPKGVSEERLQAAIELVGKAVEQDSYKAFGEKFGVAPTWLPGKKYCDFIAEEMRVFQSVKE